MQPHQQRVVEELQEVDARLRKLLNFIQSDTFSTIPKEEQIRLIQQSAFMQGYVDTLEARINAFS